MCTRAVTPATQSQALRFHTFVMKALVVVHDGKGRQVVFRSSQESPGPHIQFAVFLNIDRVSAFFFIRDRRAACRGRAIADAVSAGTADELIMFMEVPE